MTEPRNDQPLEIGVVYQDDRGLLYLATSPDTLLTFRKRKPVLVTPAKKPHVYRTISVDDLTKRWHISLDELDAEMAKHRTLPPGRLKRPPVGREAKSLLMLAWRETRMGRISS